MKPPDQYNVPHDQHRSSMLVHTQSHVPPEVNSPFSICCSALCIVQAEDIYNSWKGVPSFVSYANHNSQRKSAYAQVFVVS